MEKLFKQLLTKCVKHIYHYGDKLTLNKVFLISKLHLTSIKFRYMKYKISFFVCVLFCFDWRQKC